jgi:hypothetical protein
MSYPMQPADPLRNRPLLRLMRGALRNWLARHRHPFNFWIHLIGIPVAMTGFVLLFVQEWYWAIAAIVIGYALQAWGHRVEGNEVGELALCKKLAALAGLTRSSRTPAAAPLPLNDVVRPPGQVLSSHPDSRTSP